MKTILSILIFIPALVWGVEKDVASELKAATIFVQGAELTHSAKTTIPAGVSKLTFTNLSSNLNANSVQVKAVGDFTILSVFPKVNYLANQPESEEIKELRKKVSDLTEAKSVENELREMLEREKNLILNNANMQKEGMSAEELQAMADLYRTRLAELSGLIRSRNNKVTELNDEISRINLEINQRSASNNRYVGEITVEVKAKQQTEGRFEMTYLISQAGWSVAYDIYGGKDEDEVKLKYNAQIFQRSGLDWNQIDMTLSTGQPLQNNTQPQLHPWVVKFQAYIQEVAVTAYSNARLAEVDEAELDEIQVLSSKDVQAQTAAHFTQTVVNQLTVDYEIHEKWNIPNDGQNHKIHVTEYTLPASQEYYAAPKLDRDAFLMARITDWEQYHLLPGAANLYMDNTYIGQSYINTTVASDTLAVSLGRDRKIKFERDRVKEKCEVRMIGDKLKETIAVEIKVRNNKNHSVKIRVEDQIPLAGENEISVKLEEYEGASYNEKTGRLTWEIELAPGQSQKLNFTYTLKYPKDRKLAL